MKIKLINQRYFQNLAYKNGKGSWDLAFAKKYKKYHK